MGSYTYPIYDGPLAEMREIEKHGSSEVLRQLERRMEFRSFGVDGLLDGVFDKVKTLFRSTWSDAVLVLRGAIIDNGDHIGFKPMNPVFRNEEHNSLVCGDKAIEFWRYVDSGRDGYRFMTKWWVPDRDDASKTVPVFCCDHIDEYRAARGLLHHEIEEQLTFSGVRIFDPHKSYEALTGMKT